MSYRITLGFNAEWADFCVPRDGDLERAVLKAISEGAKVIALDSQWRDMFMAEAESFAEVVRSLPDVRLANPEDLT